ncbi:MAG: lipid-A-disaccharide synthase [Bacteroidales bacterium]|nr:lipid-A-disaccharide synthase [Bacteroidales bacterium]
MNYFLIAGEASGDLHAAHLMRELKAQDPKAEFRFFGGDLMAQEGGTLIKHYRELAFMGFIPVLLNLQTILRNMEICKNEIRKFSPDVVILVDYPGFNLEIAKFVKQELSIPVHYYISPKIWAWKEYRIKEIKRNVDVMLSILPFEVPFYAKHHYPITYVGNPTLDEIHQYQQTHPKSNDFLVKNDLNENPIVALLAGSRKQEIKKNLPLMLEASKSFPNHQFVIAGAPGIEKDHYQNYISNTHIKVVFGQTYPLLQHADAALVTSGTATLETAIFGVPQAVSYYASGGKLLYAVMEKLLKVRFVSLVNLIVDRLVVKELLGYKASAESLRKELHLLLENEIYRKEIIDGYAEMSKKLGEIGAPKNAAKEIIKRLASQTPPKVGH